MNTNSTKQVLLRRDRFLAAWREHAPDATFAKMSLDQFEAETVTPDTIGSEMEAARIKLSGLKLNRDQAVRDVIDKTMDVAAAVRGDLDYGTDCALYRALGYVPKSERKSGLTRKEEPAKPAEVSANAA